VNKKGGPDRRFNNNREIPIVIYEEILLTSKSGVQELFQASRTGIGVKLDSAVKQMASAIAQRGQPQTEDGYIKCACNNCDNSIEFLRMALAKQSLAHIAEWKRLCSNPPRRESHWDSNPSAQGLERATTWGHASPKHFQRQSDCVPSPRFNSTLCQRFKSRARARAWQQSKPHGVFAPAVLPRLHAYRAHNLVGQSA
jgi:hypothetical protein